MSDVTRRMFVSGLVAGVPAVALAGGQREQRLPRADDPVWTMIMGELQRIYGELKADPGRRDSLRALESTIRVHASYSESLGNPERLQRLVAEQLRSRRADFLQDAQRMSARDHRDAEIRSVLPGFEARPARRPDPSQDELESMARSVAARGHLPLLLSAAAVARAMSEQKPQAIVRAASAQWNVCENAEAQIAAVAFLTGVVCAAAVFNPALAPECAALGATLATMEFAYYIGCVWL